MTTESTITLAELTQALANAPDDGHQYEIVHNRLVRMPPAEHNASQVGLWLGHLLAGPVTDRRLGRLTGADGGWTLSGPPDVTIRAPDVSFVRAGRVPPQAERGAFPELAPDLAVEVLSRWEHDHPGAVLQKIGQYLDAGVRVVWVIDPRSRSVAIYQADRGPVPTSVLDDAQAVLEAAEPVPGFRTSLAELFTPFGEPLA
jgi:Uma2 family endonuclease